MFLWLTIILLAYLFFSLSSLGDKLILTGFKKDDLIRTKAPTPQLNPKLYIFYMGMLNILVIFLIPFIRFSFPSIMAIAWSMLTALVSILAIYFLFIAVEKFEVSRVVPTIGALQPIFILVLTWIFWGFQAITRVNFLAFILLLLGTLAISIEKTSRVTKEYLIITVFSSLLFSLAYVFSKLVFLSQPFLQGLVWISLFNFLLSLILLLDKDLRKQVFTKKSDFTQKNKSLFFFTQSAGAIASILQAFAISLVPISHLAIINSLRGVQYIFLFIITLFFSVLFPKVLKEEISKKAIIQKVFSMLVIIVGLALLVIS